MLGADPEILLIDQKGNPIPVCGKVGGTKEKPLAVNDREGYYLQEDNVSLEFNIPPSSSAFDIVGSIEYMLAHIQQSVLPKVGRGVTMAPQCFAEYSFGTLNKYKQAGVFGCAPDFDAYENGAAKLPVDRALLVTPNKAGEYRFAGGHIHIGYNKKKVPPFILASFCDVFIGLRCVGLDKQGPRRELYGKAGTFRETSYGMEYRTLSNFWLADRSICHNVFSAAACLRNYVAQKDVSDIKKAYSAIPWHDVQNAINNEEPELAADLVAYITAELKVPL